MLEIVATIVVASQPPEWLSDLVTATTHNKTDKTCTYCQSSFQRDIAEIKVLCLTNDFGYKTKRMKLRFCEVIEI